MQEPPLSIINPIVDHPIPFEQTEINMVWEETEMVSGEPPSVDHAHEEYTRTIASFNQWHIFRLIPPFGLSGDVYFWNREFGEGVVINSDEGEWHNLVNVFAEIVDGEGDCRDAEYCSSLRPSGSFRQRCNNCNHSWLVG